jgi:hypothetical protein
LEDFEDRDGEHGVADRFQAKQHDGPLDGAHTGAGAKISAVDQLHDTSSQSGIGFDQTDDFARGGRARAGRLKQLQCDGRERRQSFEGLQD